MRAPVAGLTYPTPRTYREAVEVLTRAARATSCRVLIAISRSQRFISGNVTITIGLPGVVVKMAHCLTQGLCVKGIVR